MGSAHYEGGNDVRKTLTALVAGTLMITATATPAMAEMQQDPQTDADCVIALSMLADQAEEAEGDAILTIAMYYFGRLGGGGKATTDFLVSRVDAFETDEALFLTEAEKCATDFQGETDKLAAFADALGD